MKEIADRIKEARLAKGMTQDELAKALGLKSRSSINKMEKNTYEIGLDRLKQIARVLDVDPDYKRPCDAASARSSRVRTIC